MRYHSNLFFSSGHIEKLNDLDPIYNYKDLYGWKFKFRETRNETAPFRKIQNFIKSERFDRFS